MNLPEAFKDQMKRLLGEEYGAYLDSYEGPRALGLRVNTAKISIADFLKITPFHLEPIPWTNNGFYYLSKEEVTKHPHYYAGLYYVQEPSAMIPASRMPVSRGDYILDLCAAPGGKATELAAKLKGSGLLVANDLSASRAKGLLKNLELFGMGNILVTSEEPSRLAGYFPRFFDKILIDAPCSGEGMFRKDPAMIKSWITKGPQFYADIQQRILQDAIRMLKPGGMILYSTCTFAEEENEENIRRLINLHQDMHTVPMPGCIGFAAGKLCNCIRIYPHKVRGEGHFVALLQKDCKLEHKAAFMQKDSESEHKAAFMQEDSESEHKAEKDSESELKISMQQMEAESKFKSCTLADNDSESTRKSKTERSHQRRSDQQSGKIKEELKLFLNSLKGFHWENKRLEIREDHVYLMPEGTENIRGLRFLRTGLFLGTLKRKRFEPSQALAMHLNMDQVQPHLSLSSKDPRVWRYLKGETLELSKEEQEGKSGWLLFGTDGYSLGWGKLVNGTLRNKYYPGWRIQ